jgi:hypothetical protein
MNSACATAATGWASLLLPWLPLLIVTTILGFLTIRIANAQKNIAATQRDIAAESKRVAEAKLKLDLFQRRLVIFDATWELLSWAMRMEPSDAYLRTLRQKRVTVQNLGPESTFLFGPEIRHYLDQVQVQIIGYESRARATMANNNVMPANQIEADHAYARWVAEEAAGGAQEKFSPFLDFSNWR